MQRLPSAAVIGSKRRIQRDDQNSRIARLLNRGNNTLGVRRCQQNALCSIGNTGFDCRNLGLVVTIHLASVGLERDAEFLGFGGRAFLILTKNGFVSVL